MADAHDIYFKPAPGERIETTLILPEEEDSCFCAQLLRESGAPVPGVLGLLFTGSSPEPADQAVSDENGRLFFGPLTPDVLYTLRLHVPHRSVRVLEIDL